MQIHHIEVTFKNRYELDPDSGQRVLRREPLLKRSGVEKIQDGKKAYTIDKDGSFEVPDALGERLVRGPGWFEGPSPFSDDE